MKWGKSVRNLLIVLVLVAFGVSQVSAGGGPYVLELAGGESSILDYEGNYMIADGAWATQDMQERFGRDLGLPNNGVGWFVPQLSANLVQNAWHLGLKDISVTGNLMIVHPLSITGRGRNEFTVIGTNLNCEHFCPNCRPALHFAGAGQLTVTYLNTGGSLCFQLNTGKVPIAVDVGRPIKIVFDGTFFQADYGPTSPAAEGRELRWPYVLPDGGLCAP